MAKTPPAKPAKSPTSAQRRSAARSAAYHARSVTGSPGGESETFHDARDATPSPIRRGSPASADSPSSAGKRNRSPVAAAAAAVSPSSDQRALVHLVAVHAAIAAHDTICDDTRYEARLESLEYRESQIESSRKRKQPKRLARKT